jgi:hypothetical protein
MCRNCTPRSHAVSWPNPVQAVADIALHPVPHVPPGLKDALPIFAWNTVHCGRSASWAAVVALHSCSAQQY